METDLNEEPAPWREIAFTAIVLIAVAIAVAWSLP
jgi:hypothetical protein